MVVLLTGVAGFIGAHVAMRLLGRGDTVIGVDALNDYYDPALKRARLEWIQARHADSFRFVHADLAQREAVDEIFRGAGFDRVIHLAAQPGVRYSLENPHAYVQSNVVAFLNVLEACRHAQVPHLTYASTSSVYGANRRMPFSETHGVDHPLQLYAATKRANELMAHAYSHLFDLPTTGLRFFTVYGPWGRPDMAPFKFVRLMLEGKPIPVFNRGNHSRDFTYVDDIAEGVVRASDRIAEPDPSWDAVNPRPDHSSAPFRVYNIGNSSPVRLMDFIKALEEALGVEAKLEMLPMQPGDVPDTYADVSALMQDVGYRPETPVREGVRRFVRWFRDYYRIF